MFVLRKESTHKVGNCFNIISHEPELTKGFFKELKCMERLPALTTERREAGRARQWMAAVEGGFRKSGGGPDFGAPAGRCTETR